MKNAAISEKVFHDAAEYINMHPGNFFKSDAEELKKFNSTEFKEHAMSELQGSMWSTSIP